MRIIQIGVCIVAIGGVVLAYDPDAHIYELVGTAYSITLVAGFAPLAFGLYAKWVNSFGALVSIVFGISGWLIAGRIGTEIPDIFIGFICSLIGIIVGSIVGAYISRNTKFIH